MLVLNILQSGIKLNFHTFWEQIVSIFDRFVVCGFNSIVQFLLVVCVFFCDFLSFRSLLHSRVYNMSTVTLAQYVTVDVL